MKKFPSVVVGDIVRSFYYHGRLTVTSIDRYSANHYADYGSAIVNYANGGSEWRSSMEVIG